MNRKLYCFFIKFICIISALSVFSVNVSADTLDNSWPGATAPEVKNYKFSPITEYIRTIIKNEYFIIKTKAGEKRADLYISLPEEGGIRLQTLHEAQTNSGVTEPEESAAGLFEPKSLKEITYTSKENKTIIKGTDGTVLHFVPDGKNFELQIYKKDGTKIVGISNEQISFAYNRRGEVLRTMVEMPLIKKEAIYGGGERFNSANQVGHTISLTNYDCWSNEQYTYKAVPLFHSNRGYSIWFNMYYVGQADIGDTNENKYSVTFDGSKLDFYLWQGMPLENLQKYTSITGTSGVSETWTYGFWTGAQNAAFESTRAKNTLTNMKELIEGYYDNYNFYPEACYAEGNAARTASINTYLKQRNIRVLGWFSPDMHKDLDTIENHLPLHSEYPTYDKDGNVTDSGLPFPYQSDFFDLYNVRKFTSKTYIDFSNPSAVDLINAVWKKYWAWGVCGTMDDFGEWYPFTGTFYNGLKGNEMHNLISYYYAKACNEAWTEQFGNDYVLFQRSGTAGSQHYTGDFLGDTPPTYDGLKSTVAALISMGASGFNLYGSDLGGHGGAPSNDLWNRWVSLTAFSPYMRQHGTVIHMPWEHGIVAKKNFGYYYYFRKNIVPMIESAAISAEKTSNPIIKGMVMAYPYQLSLANVNDQYLFCDDILVCPVTEENVYYRDVKLPKGSTWYDLYTYKAYDGGTSFTADATTAYYPVFVKGGSVKAIQLSESMTLGAEIHDDSGDEFDAIDSLLVTPPDNDRTNTIYVKQGKSTDYHTYNSTTETYLNERTYNGVFTISNEEGSNREIVIALGVSAGGVNIDGVKLKKLDHMPNYSANEYGYYVDASGLTTVYVPKGWRKLEFLKGISSFKTYALSGGSSAMYDSDIKTSYALSSTTYISLGDVKSIDRIFIKWAVGFADSYNIEYSTDYYNWYKILPDSSSSYTVENGAGDYDIIDFNKIDAKYLRIKNLKKGDAGEPRIYSFEVFGKTLTEKGEELITPIIAYVADVTGDKKVNVVDLVRLKKMIALENETSAGSGDLDASGEVDSGDLVVLVKILLKSIII